MTNNEIIYLARCILYLNFDLFDKIALNKDLVLIEVSKKVYIYYRLTDRLEESQISFEETFSKYFY